MSIRWECQWPDVVLYVEAFVWRLSDDLQDYKGVWAGIEFPSNTIVSAGAQPCDPVPTGSMPSM